MNDDSELCRRVAAIMGESSAAARALRDHSERAAEGEQVAIYVKGHTWLVGPPIGTGVQQAPRL